MPRPEDTGPLRIGDLFEEDFQILELLGEGGYGCVYRAEEKYTSRQVAIKVTKELGQADRERYERAMREAKILGTLGTHENIVQVFRARFSTKGQLYIVMELLDGMDLGRHLKNSGSFGVLEGLVLLEKLCGALSYAHDEGVIHRDIKPGNIFIPNKGQPKVLDFGVAKVADYGGFQTAPHRLIGTTLYISPEQVRGQPATARSDIYSLGLVAFQIFFRGQHPLIYQEPNVDRYNARAICNLHLRTVAPRLDQVIDGFPGYVAKIVNTMLVKEPGQRFDSMARVREQLQAARLKYETEQELLSPHRASYTPAKPEADLRRARERSPQDERGTTSAEPHHLPATASVEKRSTKKLFEEGKNNLAAVPLATMTRAQPRLSAAPPSKDSQPRRTSVAPPTRPARRGAFLAPATPPSVSRTKTIPGERTERARRWKEKWGVTPSDVASALALTLGVAAGVVLVFWANPFGEKEPPLEPGEVIIEAIDPAALLQPAAEKPERNEPRSAEATNAEKADTPPEDLPNGSNVEAAKEEARPEAVEPVTGTASASAPAPTKKSEPEPQSSPAIFKPNRPTTSPAPTSKKPPEKPEIEQGLDDGLWLE